jgi:hypothetical protein
MAIYFPETEREHYQVAASSGPHVQARTALYDLVRRELGNGADREHVLDVLESVADEYAAHDQGEREAIVLDVMDAMQEAVKPDLRL